MDDLRTTTIRERAYALWVAEGRPDGRADAHWKHAEQAYDVRQAPSVPDTSDPAASLAAEPPAGMPKPEF